MFYKTIQSLFLSIASPSSPSITTASSSNSRAQAASTEGSPNTPKLSNFVEKDIVLTDQFKSDWHAFHDHLTSTHHELQDKYKNHEIVGYRLRLPPNISNHYVDKINEYAKIHCMQRSFEGVGLERHLVLENTVFASVQEEEFVLNMASAASMQRHDVVYRIFNQMRKAELPISVHALEVLLQVNATDFTSTKLIFETMKKHNLIPSKAMCATLVSSLCACGEYEEAKAIIFDNLDKDEDSFIALIASYGNFGRVEQLHSLLAEMKAANLTPTLPIISALFEAFGMLESQSSLVGLWNNISPSDDTLADILSPSDSLPSSVFDVAPPSTTISKALSWPGLPGFDWSQLWVSKQAPDTPTTLSISDNETPSPLHVRFEQGRLEAILKLYLNASIAFSRVGCSREAKEALQAILNIIQSMKLWDESESDYIGTVSREWMQSVVYSGYMSVLDCARVAPFAVADLELLLTQGVSLGVPLRGALLIAALRIYTAEMVETNRGIASGYALCEAAIRDIMETQEVPLRALVNAILAMLCKGSVKGLTDYEFDDDEPEARQAYCARGQQNCELCFDLIEHLYAIGYPVSRTNFNQVLRACAKHTAFNTAFKVIWQMKYFDFEPTPTCYAWLISIVVRKPNQPEIETVRNMNKFEMLLDRYNYFPAEDLCNNILRLFWQFVSDHRHASKWMGRMIKENRAFDKLSVTRFFNNLLQQVDANNYFLALGMVQQLPQGMTADLHLYNTLLEAGAILGNVGQTLTLFEKLQFNGITPDVRSYGVVIGCLLKSRPSSTAQKRLNLLVAEMKAAGFTQEAEQIMQGEVCRMFPRLQTGAFTANAIIWKPSASERAILEWTKQQRHEESTIGF